MLESLWANVELEQEVSTLRSLAVLVHSWERVVLEVADMLEAAAAVQAFQLEHGILMRLCLVCQDSQATEKLSVRLHDLADCSEFRYLTAAAAVFVSRDDLPDLRIL